MKKLTYLLALGIMLLMPFTAKADWTQHVSDKNGFLNAIAALEGTPGSVDSIIVDGDNNTVINVGRATITATDGKVVITSKQKNINKVPQLIVEFYGSALKDGNKFSLFFENIGLRYRAGRDAGSGQIIYFQKIYAPMDSLVFRGCDINQFPRTLYRNEPVVNNDLPGKHEPGGQIQYLELSDSKIHDGVMNSGEYWSLFVLGQNPQEINIKNNMFYDTPYQKSMLEMSNCTPDGSNPVINFENNTVLLGNGPYISTKGNTIAYKIFDTNNSLGVTAQYNIRNNLFWSPEGGGKADTGADYILPSYNDSTLVVNTVGGLLSAQNNILKGYMTDWNNGHDAEDADNYWTYTDVQNTYTLDDANLKWADFYDPSASNYILLKSSKAYTMGTDGQPIGAPMMYVDEFPKEVPVTVTIEGGTGVEYTISPVKAKYYKDDEVTITLNAHNSNYRNFNTFKGWSDGSQDLQRTITLGDEGFNQTASFEAGTDGKILAAYDFRSVGGDKAKYDADLYLNNLDNYKSTLKQMSFAETQTVMDADTIVKNSKGKDSTIIVLLDAYKEKVAFQTRAQKFGDNEEPAERHMAVISRRTPAIAKEAGKMDYAFFNLNTKGIKGIHVSAYTGSDNNIFEKQNLDYSLDGGKTWTNFGGGTVTGILTWAELTGDLPDECEGKDTVLVRIISDPTTKYFYNPAAYPDLSGEALDAAVKAQDGFAYVGNILVTYEEANPASPDEKTSWKLNAETLNSEKSDKATWTFGDGFTITNTANKGAGAASGNTLKYSRNTQFTIHVPADKTVRALVFNGYTNGSAADGSYSYLGELAGNQIDIKTDDKSSEFISQKQAKYDFPGAVGAEEVQDYGKYAIVLDQPVSGADITFTFYGTNQVAAEIEAFANAQEALDLVKTSWTLDETTLDADNSDKTTWAFADGFTITNTANKGAGVASANTLKYSRNTQFTIHVPAGKTVAAIVFDGYTNGSAADGSYSYLGELAGKQIDIKTDDKTSDFISKKQAKYGFPGAVEAGQEQGFAQYAVTLDEPVTGGDITFTFYGTNQVAAKIKLFTTAEEAQQTVTGISHVTVNAPQANPNAPIYTISGVRVSKQNLQKGIYIQNGKKFIVK